MQILKPSKKSLKIAVEVLSNGGVVVCPTDTVYGFLVDAENKKAINKIYKIKKRPKSKSLPVFIFSIKKAKEIAEISTDQEKILKKYWPGKYTFVLKAKSQKLKVKNNTIALRMPNHKFLLSLLKKFGKPLAQTSVNISGQPELNKVEYMAKISGIDLIIDASRLPKRKQSQVFDMVGKVLTKLR